MLDFSIQYDWKQNKWWVITVTCIALWACSDVNLNMLFFGVVPKKQGHAKNPSGSSWNNDMSGMLERGYQTYKNLFVIHIVHLLLPGMTFPFMNKHAKHRIIGKNHCRKHQKKVAKLHMNTTKKQTKGNKAAFYVTATTNHVMSMGTHSQLWPKPVVSDWVKPPVVSIVEVFFNDPIQKPDFWFQPCGFNPETCWWLNQPLWKILVKLGIFPR